MLSLGYNTYFRIFYRVDSAIFVYLNFLGVHKYFRTFSIVIALFFTDRNSSLVDSIKQFVFQFSFLIFII